MLTSLDGMSALAQGDISQSGEAKNPEPNDKESAGNAADSGADSEEDDSEDTLTEEELEQIKRQMEEEEMSPLDDGDPGTGGTGNKVNMEGKIYWTGDAYWKNSARPKQEAALLAKIKVVKIPNNDISAATPVPADQYMAEWNTTGQGENTFKYKIVDLPPLEAEDRYVVQLDPGDNYKAIYPNDAGFAESEKALIGEDYEVADLTAELQTTEKTISGTHYGTASTASYTVEAFDAASSQLYAGAYIDGTESKTAKNGVVTMNLAGAETTVTLTVPKNFNIRIKDVATGCFFVEPAAGGEPNYTFVGKTTAAVKKKWLDTLNDARPKLTFDLFYTLEGDTTQKAVTQESYNALGFAGDPAFSLNAPNETDHASNQDYSFSNLPQYWKDDSGIWKKTTYTMKEKEVENYSSSTVTKDGVTTITNTRTKKVTADILWKDDGDSGKERPGEVKLHIFRYSGKKEDAVEITESIREEELSIVKNQDVWSVTYNNLSAYDDTSKPYTYYITQEKVPAAIYGTPKYRNEGEHSQVTDVCFSGGKIINTKGSLTNFSVRYVWAGMSTGPKPAGKIYLWRYIAGKDPSTAAIVKEKEGDVYTLEAKPVDTTLDEGAIATLYFTNLQMYDEDGKDYVYIAKAAYDADTDYIYVYPNEEKIYAEEDEKIVLMPQKMENISFTMTWNTLAYPEIPKDYTALVHVEKKVKNDSTAAWRRVRMEKPVEFDGFAREIHEKDMILNLPKYDTEAGTEGKELEYRIVLDKVYKAGEAEAVVTDGVFTLGGQTYRTVSDENGNVVNSLYGPIIYEASKTWNPQPDDMNAASATVSLRDSTGKKLQELTLNAAGGWTKAFDEINRFDEKGSEITFEVTEDDFEPRGTYGNGIRYTRRIDTAGKEVVTAHISNYHPDGKYKLSVSKKWVDGGDYQGRKPVKMEIVQKGSTTPEKIVELTVGNNWIQTETIENAPTEYEVREVSATDGDGEKNVEYDRAKTGLQEGEGSLITSAHRYIVTTQNAVVTNKVLGYVRPTVAINWQDGKNQDGRVDVTATLQKQLADGSWVDVQDIIMTKDNAAAGGTRGETEWTETFNVQDKYSDDGKLINYRIVIEYDKNQYNKTGESKSYISKETAQTYVKDEYTDSVTMRYTLTKTGSTSISFKKEWIDDGSAVQPDINIHLFYRLKGATEDPKPYLKTQTDYGYVERVWKKDSPGHYTCTIRNLDAADENGVPYEYFVREQMHIPGDYVGYYFASTDKRAKWETAEDDGTIVLKNQLCPANGVIVNRQEATVKVEGRKIWNNLEPGMTSSNLPSPVIYLRRFRGSVEDTEFNKRNSTGERQYQVVLDDINGKYSYSFGTEHDPLPKFDKDGQKYTYTVKEDFSVLTDFLNPYDSYTTTTNDFAIVNEYITGPANTREIKVTKKWNSQYQVAGARYPSVKFILYRDGVLFAEKTLTGGKNVDATETEAGSVVFEDLRIVSPMGKKYVYTVKEVSVNGYVERVIGGIIGAMETGPDGVKATVSEATYDLDEYNADPGAYKAANDREVTFTNQYVGNEYTAEPVNPSVVLKGSKNWKELSGETQWRKQPELKVIRYVDGENPYTEDITSKCEVTWTNTNTTDAKWTYSVSPKTAYADEILLTYGINGRPYKYRVEEQAIPNYTGTTNVATSGKKEGNTLIMSELNNELTGELIVVKKWSDQDDRYGLRPKVVTVKIQRANVANPSEDQWQDVTVGGNLLTKDIRETDKLELPDDSTPGKKVTTAWAVKITGLSPKEEGSGNDYKYRAVETHIGGEELGSKSPYIATHHTTKRGEQFRTEITNTVQAVNLKVTKTWKGDENNKYNTRPLNSTKDKWRIKLDLQYRPDGGNWSTFSSHILQGDKDSPSGEAEEVLLTGLPKCNLKGVNYEYRAVENGGGPKNYTVSRNDSTVADATGKTYVNSLTNTMKLEESQETSVKVTKKWVAQELLKREVQVDLLKSTDGKTYTSCGYGYVKLNEDNRWTYKWTNVPAYNSGGYKLFYSVKEITTFSNVKADATKNITPLGPAGKPVNDKVFEITNREIIDYKLQTVWENNTYGLTDKATFVLYRKKKNVSGSENAQTDRTQSGVWEVVNAAKYTKALQGNKTMAEWKGLPKSDVDGNEYVYQAVETKIGNTSLPKTNPSDDYRTYKIKNESLPKVGATESTREVQGHKITNTLVTTDKSGIKKWDFSALNETLKADTAEAIEYRKKLMPENITLTLQSQEGTAAYANVKKASAPVVTKQQDNILQDWSYKYTELPKYALNGTTELSYRAVETLPDNSPFIKEETAATSGADKITTITNKFAQNETSPVKETSTKIEGRKNWSESGNAYTMRPSSLTITVKEDNKAMNPQPKIVWTQDNTIDQWTYTISGLPKYVKDGTGYRLAKYTTEESTVPPGYVATDKTGTSEDGDAYKLVNKPLLLTIVNTKKDGDVNVSADILKNATFTLIGDFQKSDGTTEAGVRETINLEADGKLVLKPDAMKGRRFIAGKEYSLIQTAAQSGYQKMTGAVKFKFDETTGELVFVKKDGKNEAGKIADTMEEATYSDAGKINNSKSTPAILQIQNIKTSGSVVLKKVEAQNKTVLLQGVKFFLYKQKGNEPDPDNDTQMAADLTTNNKGEIKCPGLEEGNYYFKEIQTRSSYELDSTPKKFTITEADHNKSKTLEVENNKLTVSVILKKLDEDGKTPLKDVHFKLEGTTTDSTPVNMDLVTDNNGVAKYNNASVELHKGTYTITEVTPKGYFDKIPSPQGHNVAFSCTIKVEDKSNGKNIIINNKTKSEEGIEFTVDPDVKADFLTDNGVVNKRIPGTVTIKKVDKDDRTKDLNNTVFELQKKKESENIFNWIADLITGKRYEVVYTDLTFGNGTTGSDGVITITNLPWGTYMLIEKTAKPGYFMGADAPEKDFVIGPDNALTGVTLDYNGGTIENEKTKLKIGAVEEYKTTAQNPIEGVDLQIKGKMVADDGSSKEETIQWNTSEFPTSTPPYLRLFEEKLISGETYEITQPSVRDGYEPWKEAVKVRVKQDGTFELVQNENLGDQNPTGVLLDGGKTLYLRNVEIKGVVELSKRDAETDQPLAGVEFKLFKKATDPNPDVEITVAGGISTDVNGKWNSFSKIELPEGEYYFMETKAPAGYRVDTDTKYTFSIGKNNHYVEDAQKVECLIRNIPLLTLVDKNKEGEVLGAYRFRIKGTFKNPVTGAEEEKTYEIVKEPDPAKPDEITIEDLNKWLIPENEYTMVQEEIDSGYNKVPGEIRIKITNNGIWPDPAGELPPGYTISDDGAKLIVVNPRRSRGPSGGDTKKEDDEDKEESEPEPGTGEDIPKPDTTGKDPSKPSKPSKPERPSTYVVEVIGWFYPPEGGAPQYTTIVVSSDNPNALNGRLVPGQSYRVNIINAPDGYEGPLTDTLFVDADGNIHCGDLGRFLLNGMPYIRTTRPVAARTGDGNPAVWWTIIFLLSMFMMLLLGRKNFFVEKS